MLKLILASILFTACTTDTATSMYEPQRPSATGAVSGELANDHGDDQTVTVVESADRRSTTVLAGDTTGSVDLGSTPCACETLECLQNWAESTVGCNVIVDLVCADGRRAAFSPCATPVEPTAASAGTQQ